MTADVDMVDAETERIEEQVRTVKLVVAELNVIGTAVPAVDLRSLSRLKMALIKTRMTEQLLKRCVQVLVSPKDVLKDLVLGAAGGKGTEKLDEKVEKVFEGAKKVEQAEVGFFFAILALDMMLNKTKASQDNTARFVTQLVVQLGNLNRRTLDFFASKIYQYFGRITDDSELIRNDLLAIYRTACLRRDAGIQATVLNLILRNFLKASLHEQASQFVSKTSFPETRTNAELARYLFYIGQMRSVQMNYTEAQAKLAQALRKAPQGSKKALAFKVIAWKFMLTVQLLMGEIPERKQFLQKEMAGYLKPYEEVATAVRGGSVPQFESVVNKYSAVFKEDGTFTLVNRLRYNVIKTGLRKINHSYSRISLKDIAAKLGLESPEDAAGICSKAIADGVINASLDYDQGYVLSKSIQDVYSTDEPQVQLHKRIAFCLQLHNDCVRSMEYPSKADAQGATEDDDPSKKNRETAELIAEAEEEDDIDMM